LKKDAAAARHQHVLLHAGVLVLQKDWIVIFIFVGFLSVRFFFNIIMVSSQKKDGLQIGVWRISGYVMLLLKTISRDAQYCGSQMRYNCQALESSPPNVTLGRDHFGLRLAS
jgi:hypothetical protein